MTLTDFDVPTPQEIDARIHAAHVARAHAMRGWATAATRWLAHPHFGPRTA